MKDTQIEMRYNIVYPLLYVFLSVVFLGFSIFMIIGKVYSGILVFGVFLIVSAYMIAYSLYFKAKVIDNDRLVVERLGYKRLDISYSNIKNVQVRTESGGYAILNPSSGFPVVRERASCRYIIVEYVDDTGKRKKLKLVVDSRVMDGSFDFIDGVVKLKNKRRKNNKNA